ncbi:MAG: hypothetical protein PHW31_04490 [Candidatus Pacebacteria bacterium]|nr:hypothetical protein [Candidatus Paceibacterota bacterium]
MNISQSYILITIVILAVIMVALILIKRKKIKPLWQETPRRSKFMFFTGIAFAVASAVLLLTGLMGDSTFPTILGAMGIVFIAASNFRIFK